MRGGGEGGTTPALGAVVNAIVDALAELGVEHVEMPATPERVWRAIRAARGGKPMSGLPPIEITVYAIAIERLTGKETPLPAVSQRWPSVDQTRSPNAVPPAAG